MIEITTKEKQQLIKDTKEWLGKGGILYFKEIARWYGSLSAVWLEFTKMRQLDQYLPRSVESQDSKIIKRFLKSNSVCRDWSDKDLDDNWLWIIEECIK